MIKFECVEFIIIFLLIIEF